MQTPKTILTLTPVAVDRDSRSVRIASSFARYGYRSVVVQNRINLTARQDYPFELLTFGNVIANLGQQGNASTPDGTARLFPAWIRDPVHFIRFFFMYMVLRPLQGLFLTPRADLIYLHEYRLFPTAWLITLFRKVPIVYDAHDFYPEVWPPATLSPFWRYCFSPFLQLLEKQCIRHASSVVTVGRGVAQLIKQRYGASPLILRNCHDSRLEQKPVNGLRQLTGINDDDFLIAVIGNRKPGMAISPLLEALAQMDEDVHVAFIGRSHEQTLSEIMAAGLARQAHMVGAVQPEEVAVFCKDADAALLPYYCATRNVENIAPNGFFNALAAGLPLLYPRLPEIIELIGDHEVGLEIDPLSPQTLRAAIRQLQKMGKGINTIRRNAGTLSAEISWQIEERKLVDHVKSLMDHEFKIENR